jgi:lipopolysaccharide heptosyltransferase I
MKDDARPSLLVVRLSALGDVIHTIPAVVALENLFDIDWVVENPYRELVEIVAGVRAIPVSLKRWSAKNIAAARRGVRGHQLAIDFQGLTKSALLARASGAGERYGFASAFIREKPAAWLMNRHVTIDPAAHVVEWNLQLARALAPEASMPDVDFSRFAADDSTGKIACPPRIVLIPGAGKPDKQWPVERFRELARRLGRDVITVWGPGERELADEIGAEVVPPTNLRELAGVLLGARMVIGGDTGPLHLAAALRVPVVGLYGPTNPARNGPYGQLANCVSTFATTRSMMTIEVADVMAKIGEVMA